MHSKERSLEHPSYMTDGCQNEILIEAGLSGVVLGLSLADCCQDLCLDGETTDRAGEMSSGLENHIILSA